MKDIELIEYLVDNFDDFGPLEIDDRSIKTFPRKSMMSSEWISLEQEKVRRFFHISTMEDNRPVLIFPLEDKK